MTSTADRLLCAARVPEALKPQGFGTWLIERYRVPPELDWVGWPTITTLRRYTEATLHLNGEVVMEDSRQELSRHLPIWLAARGRVLITGLGLGCVVRGLLALPAIEHIDVVELDRDILRVVGPEFEGNPRVSLRHGDALKVTWPRGTCWDYAWHDIWCPSGSKLHTLHAKLLCKYRLRVGYQGAWMLPRVVKRSFSKMLKLIG